MNNIVNVLGENYGYNRKSTDDGGYVCIVEGKEEIEYFKEYFKSNRLKRLLGEFSRENIKVK